MNPAPYEVIAIEALQLHGPPVLQRVPLMSPYVWRMPDGGFAMLFRAVGVTSRATGSIWLATGDGLDFSAGAEPVLAPEPGSPDARGCEDPTLVPVADGCLVYYTGVGPDRSAQLMWARGPDPGALEKRGIAHCSPMTDRNTKEAALAFLGDRWIMLFEYTRDGRSRVGRGEAALATGPWEEQADPFLARPGRWDGWHLSTGPLLVDEPFGPVMFYNGATRDAVWAIGWLLLDRDCAHVVARCEEPLVSAPTGTDPDGRKISFAASAVTVGAHEIWLYYTHDDRVPMRARIRRASGWSVFQSGAIT